MSSVPAPPPRHRKRQEDSGETPMMAGAAHNVARHLAPTYQDVSSTPNLQEVHSRSAALKDSAMPRPISPTSLEEGIPETTIGEYVTVKGELEFDRLLRIDGSFEGRLISEGDLVIGPQGKLTGPVEKIRSMLVEGHVIGDIQVERLALRGAAFVYGNITCKSISVEPGVMISGNINIHPLAPKLINPDGSVSSGAAAASDAQVSGPAHQREKGDYHFPSSEKKEEMVVSSDKRTLVPAEGSQSISSIDSDTARKEHEEIKALQQLSEQRTQLENQITEQKEHAARAREEEERELKRLKAEADRLKEEETRHVAEAKRLQEAAATEVARLKAEAAKREETTLTAGPPENATPPPDIAA